MGKPSFIGYRYMETTLPSSLLWGCHPVAMHFIQGIATMPPAAWLIGPEAVMHITEILSHSQSNISHIKLSRDYGKLQRLSKHRDMWIRSKLLLWAYTPEAPDASHSGAG